MRAKLQTLSTADNVDMKAIDSQIEKMLTTPDIEFILVGALHLAGPDSVLKMLTDKRYKVEKL